MKSKIAIALIALSFATSCKKEEVETEEVVVENVFNVAADINDVTYLAQVKDLTEGDLTFVDNGRELDAVVAARVISSGDYVYSLNYGTGVITQLEPLEDGTYSVVKELNAGAAVGTEYPRFKIADENTILIHNVVVEDVLDDESNVVDKLSTMQFASIAIPSLQISYIKSFVIPQSENAQEGGTVAGFDCFRVDAPVISDGKIYYGMMHNDQFEGGRGAAAKTSGLETLVFDYPTLENGYITESDAATGHTNGYRMPCMHVDESGDVYQVNEFMTSFQFDLTDGDKTVITRLKDGAYDDSYVFNVSEAIGESISTVGWFYVGDGIGYMPIHLEGTGASYGENTWSIARIDLNNKTAVKLDVPLANYFEYQSAVVNDGKFYMAVSPIDGESYVYEFDPTSTSADGFTKGLKLDGDNINVQGLY